MHGMEKINQNLTFFAKARATVVLQGEKICQLIEKVIAVI